MRERGGRAEEEGHTCRWAQGLYARYIDTHLTRVRYKEFGAKLEGVGGFGQESGLYGTVCKTGKIRPARETHERARKSCRDEDGYVEGEGGGASRETRALGTGSGGGRESAIKNIIVTVACRPVSPRRAKPPGDGR